MSLLPIFLSFFLDVARYAGVKAGRNMDGKDINYSRSQMADFG